MRDESVGGDNPFRWEDKTTDDYFKGKRVVVFSLPGVYSNLHISINSFENNAEKFHEKGIDDIYCISVNDSFVMNRWAASVRAEGLRNVKVIPDGNAEFTAFRHAGMFYSPWI